MDCTDEFSLSTKSECPDIWIRLPKHKWPKSWSSMEYPVFPLEGNLYGHPLAGLLWERQFEKVPLEHGWVKVPNWECFFVKPEKGLFLSVYVDDIKLAGKKQNTDPTWKIHMKDVDLGEPTSFLDHVYLGYTQPECQKSEVIVDNYRNMFEFKISTGAQERLRYSDKFGANISSWSYDLHALTTINLKKKKFDLSENCQRFALLVSECLYLARIGRPDILWSVNKFARTVTKLTKTCYKRLARLISYMHYTSEFKQYCHVGNTAQQCRLGLFQDSDFGGELEDSKSTSGGLLSIFGSHTFSLISWMCTKQTSVSHSSTEAETNSLDASLPMDGVPVLDHWDVVIEVFQSSLTN